MDSSHSLEKNKGPIIGSSPNLGVDSQPTCRVMHPYLWSFYTLLKYIISYSHHSRNKSLRFLESHCKSSQAAQYITMWFTFTTFTAPPKFNTRHSRSFWWKMMENGGLSLLWFPKHVFYVYFCQPLSYDHKIGLSIF